MQENSLGIVPKNRLDRLYQRVSAHIENAREHIQHTIYIEMVKTYWLTGKEIVDEEQVGQARAEYGKAILNNLSKRLQSKYHRGFSVDTLEKARKFFLIYQEEASPQKSATLSRISHPPYSCHAYHLEFLGIPENHKIAESTLENLLIDNLQHFLLELGQGFAFIGRQKRLTFDNDHYYADLVFYHVILKCYVILDIKTHKLTHADLGQMQLYVNYFDKEIKQGNDNPTVGLVLCTDKSDEMVKYMLGEKAKQIFASNYQFHLPTEKELEKELKRELNHITQAMKDQKKVMKIHSQVFPVVSINFQSMI